MLNKKLNENDVRKLFEVHGAIEECTVLRDQNGQSKGCAFVTFATKHAAISAIKLVSICPARFSMIFLLRLSFSLFFFSDLESEQNHGRLHITVGCQICGYAKGEGTKEDTANTGESMESGNQY